MITPTSLNEAFLDKVRAAAREATHLAAVASIYCAGVGHPQGQAYVKNRRGRLMMRVDYQYGRQPAIRFWEQSRRDITPMITKALGGFL